ncbi:ER membrane protein complex subunit 1 isoform X2 [Ischnura elegans]|uniref:ER membrane protein complex subunit 1 isoform X2 n=1 Tax=Ischnura elegans TaxID=197161 RepID=UPI001ED889E9|nr:ER membrane protein complex subunit 1 isoform X2 [Ischnura elegans]
MSRIFVTLLFLKCSLLSLCLGLYEDQIGKFDWRQQYVGQPIFSQFGEPDTGKVYVATEKNVVAAFHWKRGLVWRQVLERGDQGAINLLYVGPEVLTVSGSNPVYVRKWDANYGFITMDATIQSKHLDSPGDKKWSLKSGILYQVHLNLPSQIAVSTYSAYGGAELSYRLIPSQWVSKTTRCIVIGGLLACLQDKVLRVIDMCEEDSSFKIVSLPFLEQWSDLDIGLINGAKKVIEITSSSEGKKAIFSLDGIPEEIVKPSIIVASNALVSAIQWEKNQLGIISAVQSENSLQLALHLLDSGDNVAEFPSELQLPVTVGKVSIQASHCVPGKMKSCMLFLSSEDHTIMLYQLSAGLIWSREEALSSIVSVEILELPVSDMDAVIENSFDSKEDALNKRQHFYKAKSTGFMGMLWRRLSSQMLQIRALLMKALGVEDPVTGGPRTGPVRDGFGLHRMIVAASSVGKLFGIDNLSGEIIWQRRLEPKYIPLQDKATGSKHMPLFVLRTTSHFPLPAHCALLLKDRNTGEGVLYLFNPMSGQHMSEYGFDEVASPGYYPLGYSVTQCSMLHYQASEETVFLKGLLILDSKGAAHLYPKWISNTLMDLADHTFLYVADPTTGVLSGFSFAKTSNQEISAKHVWEVVLPPGTQQITAVASKNPMERVNSQGRVLADRSVLYKYINPNLVAFISQGVDPVHKHFLNLYLIDVVSGTIVFSLTHKRAKGPVHILHSENWVVYSYYNDKSRRTEVASLELYEGKVQSNSTAFSSVTTPLQPIVERQAYILPAVVDAMKETITEKGITSKHILMALSTGGILELPWMFVDPRRPIMAMSEMRDEGVIPYIPELPIPMDAIINYNKTVMQVNGIHTSPSGLESTCLVFVYGLDLFYTRVAPSKTFDLLKEDFDHFLISAVLLGLTVASYLTRKLSARKALKQAWK